MPDIYLTTTVLAVCLGLLIIGYCALLALYWLRVRAAEQAQSDSQELARWRHLSEAYLSSLIEFPDVYTALANLSAAAKHGQWLASDNANRPGPWTIQALRDVLRTQRADNHAGRHGQQTRRAA